MSLYVSAIVSGIFTSAIYALVAIGITQTFKVTRVLNFAMAGFMFWGAYLYSFLGTSLNWPVGWAALASVAAVSLMGLVCEFIALRFASRATTANQVILTFGLLEILTALVLMLFGNSPRTAPSLFPNNGIYILGTRVVWSQIGDLAAVAASIAALHFFLMRTRTGLLTRSVVENSVTAQLLGVRVRRTSAINWLLTAAMAGLAGVLIAGIQPFTATDFSEYFALALVGCLIGGLDSLVLSAAGAMATGIVTSVTGVAFSSIGTSNLVVFLIVVVVALIRGRVRLTSARVSPNAAAAVPDASRSWLGQRVVFIGGGVALTAAALTSPVWAQNAALVVTFAVASLSLVPLSGWTGQISLAQGGFMGVGAYTAATAFNYYQLPMVPAILVGVAAGFLFGMILGVIAAKLSFIASAIVTLIFTMVVSGWLLYLTQIFHALAGEISFVPDPALQLGSGTEMFLVYGIVLAVILFGLSNLRRSPLGHRMVAARESPGMAEQFGLRPVRSRVMAFGLSGAVAGLAGIMLLGILTAATPDTFGSSLSLEVMLFAAAGGVGALYGPLMSSIGFIAVPQLIGVAQYSSTMIPELLSGVAVTQLMATTRDGLVSMTRRPRRLATEEAESAPARHIAAGDPRGVRTHVVNVSAAGRPEDQSRTEGTR